MRREGAVEPRGDGRFAIPPDYVSRALAADQARHGPADVEVRVLDVRPLHLQTEARGVTWLDRVAGGLEPDPGLGSMADEARRLGQERAEARKGWGIGDGSKLTDKDMLALWKMEIEAQFKRLGKDEKLVVKAVEGQPFSGVYNDRVHMGGRTYAAVESRSVVTLAPWRAGLEAWPWPRFHRGSAGGACGVSIRRAGPGFGTRAFSLLARDPRGWVEFLSSASGRAREVQVYVGGSLDPRPQSRSCAAHWARALVIRHSTVFSRMPR